jgi:hypothetical protein
LNWVIATEIIKVLAWPTTIIFLGWLLRREVIAVIGRVESAKLPGAEFTFGKSSVDQISNRKTRTALMPTANRADWAKTGNLYWLANDIMWTIDALLRGAPGNAIVYGLRQSLHHLRELGLEESSYGNWLVRMYGAAGKLLESEWTPDIRNQYALDLRRLSDQLGTIAESQQMNFVAEPSSEQSNYGKESADLEKAKREIKASQGLMNLNRPPEIE